MSAGNSRVVAGITTSVDGYIAGPNDGPGNGLGDGGERLHNWVMGGPWTYESEHDPGSMSGVDKEFFDDAIGNVGTGICGRGMYDASGAWGGTNPFGGTLFILTHRTADAPDASSGFEFVDDLATAFDRAAVAADGKDISVGGGADLIRQSLAAGYVDELTISIAPVILGGGRALFDGFTQDVDLTPVRVYASPWATHIRYQVG